MSLFDRVALTEAQLDAGKAKKMAQKLRKLWKDSGAIIPSTLRSLGSGQQWMDAILDSLEKSGNISTDDSLFLTQAFPAVVKAAEKKDPKLHKAAQKYDASLKRMHALNVTQDKQDRDAARKAKKAKLNPADVKKFSYVHFYKGGKERSGKIMWVGPSKFKKGEMSYGVKVGAEKKLVYIGLGHIFAANLPEPAYKKKAAADDGDFWHDAGKDMNAELGTKGVYYSKAAIKKHFGWK